MMQDFTTTPQADPLDPEFFARVWRRVMPDDANSQIQLVAQEAAQATPIPDFQDGFLPLPEPAVLVSQPLSNIPAYGELPQIQPPQCPGPGYGQCLGTSAMPNVTFLQEMMNEVQTSINDYQWLLRKTTGRTARTLSALVQDNKESLRRLAATYFLITGERHVPKISGLKPTFAFADGLRMQFIRQQHWASAYSQVACQCADTCMKQLMQELAQQSMDEGLRLRLLVEQLPLIP